MGRSRGLKIVETVKVTFGKTTSKDETIIKTAYFKCETFTITNNNRINKKLQLSKQQIMNKIAQWISEGSGWSTESVDNHNINIVKYNPLRGSSYIKLPKELRNTVCGPVSGHKRRKHVFLTSEGLQSAEINTKSSLSIQETGVKLTPA